MKRIFILFICSITLLHLSYTLQVFDLRLQLTKTIKENEVKFVPVSRANMNRRSQGKEDILKFLQKPDMGEKAELYDESGQEQGNTAKYMDIRILTFNIRHGVDKEGKQSLDSIIQEIKSTEAHIIALQEVDKYIPRSGFKFQAREIANALGYYYAYGDNISVLGIKYGNAVISKYPIVEYENQKLPSNSIETRGLLKVKIDVEGTYYNVYTTHLGLDYQERERQIEAINNVLLNEKKKNLILLGDFNANPQNPEMLKLIGDVIDVAVLARKEELNTYAFYSDVPNTRIDRIYVNPGIEVKHYDVFSSKTSDHCMVLVTISHEIKKKEEL